MAIKLDYKLDSPEERLAYVEKILEEHPEIHRSPSYLEYLTDYLIFCMEKQERKNKKILTDNRMTTVNKRETSFEGLAAQFDQGEDGVYTLMTEDKNIIFRPKIQITKEDIEMIPELTPIISSIAFWERQLPNATGKDAYIIKRTIIDFRKEQYFVKTQRNPPVICFPTFGPLGYIPLDSTEYLTPEGKVEYSGISFLDYKVCSAVLRNYSALKEAGALNHDSDTWYFMEDFDALCVLALTKYPIYDEIVTLKIDGLSSADIQQAIQEKFGIHYTLEYISSLWRKKIPRLIAQTAQGRFIIHWYETHNGTYKKCTKCGEEKPAHSHFFSHNCGSRDGFYSICKSCRSRARSWSKK